MRLTTSKETRLRRPTCTCIPSRGQTDVERAEHVSGCPLKVSMENEEALRELEREDRLLGGL